MDIKQKLKEYCEYEIKCVQNLGYNPHEATTRCYGATMFVLNMDNYDEELAKWWDDEMLPRFRELERERIKGAK